MEPEQHQLTLREKAGQLTGVVLIAIELILLPQVAKADGPLSTDWQVCATIQWGEGVIPALQRAGGGYEPLRYTNSGVAIDHTNDGVWNPDQFEWFQSIVKGLVNPAVYLGNSVCQYIPR